MVLMVFRRIAQLMRSAPAAAGNVEVPSSNLGAPTMYSTYVLENPKGRRYTRSTNDFAERLRMHNDTSSEKARFHRTTYRKGPWKLIFEKQFSSREDALRLEKYLKTGVGREWLERGSKIFWSTFEILRHYAEYQTVSR